MKMSIVKKAELLGLINTYFSWCEAGMSWREVGDNMYDLYAEGFNYDSGATKYCFWHRDFDNYVVKFCIDKDFDYCEREYTNYLAAVEKELDYFFPYTDYICSINGVKFYVQEKCYINEAQISDSFYKDVRERDNFNWDGADDENIINERIWDAVSDLEDDDRLHIIFGWRNIVDDLVDFCYKMAINDLHEGNYGYIGDRPVIIDFSGYGDAAKFRGKNW